MRHYLEDGDPIVINDASGEAYRDPQSGTIGYEITQLADAEISYWDEETEELYPVQYDMDESPDTNDSYGDPYVEIPSTNSA